MKPPAAPAYSNWPLFLWDNIFGWTTEIFEFFSKILTNGEIQFGVTSISELTIIKYLESIFFKPSL